MLEIRILPYLIQTMQLVLHIQLRHIQRFLPLHPIPRNRDRDRGVFPHLLHLFSGDAKIFNLRDVGPGFVDFGTWGLPVDVRRAVVVEEGAENFDGFEFHGEGVEDGT